LFCNYFPLLARDVLLLLSTKPGDSQMKKLALALAVVSAVAAPAAMAATYKIDQTQSSVYFYIDGASQVNNWNLSNLRLVVNEATGLAALGGTMTRTGSSATYSLAVAFTTPYSMSAGMSNWQDFTGAITNLTTGRSEIIRDYQPGRGAMDSAVGVNAAPYNGANNPRLELGFWAYNVGTQRHDFNVTLTCTSGTGASGPANANGSCTTGGGTNVPLPGTLALFGLAAVGMGARRIKLV
jgi:PEP-CTERM motif